MFEKALAPGGYYFIEDMQVNGLIPFPAKDMPYPGKVVLLEIVAGWMQEIIFGHYPKDAKEVPGYSKDVENQYHDRARMPLPKGVKSIFCYPEACILKKCKKGDINRRCTGLVYDE